MRHPIRRSVYFTLHFSQIPVQPNVACLSPHASPADAVELLCDGALLHRYTREDGSVIREYICDTTAHSFTLRTCGTVQFISSVEIPADTGEYRLEAREAERFRLTVTSVTDSPAEADISACDTTYAICEALVGMLLEREIDFPQEKALYIRFLEDRFGVFSENREGPYSFDDAASYADTADSPNDGNHFTRLSVRNRSHLQRFAYGYLRNHPELENFRFEWQETQLRVTAPQLRWVTREQLRHEIYFGCIAAVFRDEGVRCARLFADRDGYTLHCYNDHFLDSRPMAGRSLRLILAGKDEAHTLGTAELHAISAAAVQDARPADTNIRADNCGSCIALSRINDPYFTFD